MNQHSLFIRKKKLVLNESLIIFTIEKKKGGGRGLYIILPFFFLVQREWINKWVWDSRLKKKKSSLFNFIVPPFSETVFPPQSSVMGYFGRPFLYLKGWSTVFLRLLKQIKMVILNELIIIRLKGVHIREKGAIQKWNVVSCF